MIQMNFSDKWGRLVSECVSTVTASILVNGIPTDEFVLEMGFETM